MTQSASQSDKAPVHQRDATCLPPNARTVLLYVLSKEGSGHGH